MIIGPDDHFYIEAGVHRSVAAREVGLTEITAQLHVPGCQSEMIVVPLDRLHSYRRTVLGFRTQRHNLPALIRAMADPMARAKVPAIELQRLGTDAQPRTIPLADVIIVDEEEEP